MAAWLIGTGGRYRGEQQQCARCCCSIRARNSSTVPGAVVRTAALDRCCCSTRPATAAMCRCCCCHWPRPGTAWEQADRKQGADGAGVVSKVSRPREDPTRDARLGGTALLGAHA